MSYMREVFKKTASLMSTDMKMYGNYIILDTSYNTHTHIHTHTHTHTATYTNSHTHTRTRAQCAAHSYTCLSNLHKHITSRIRPAIHQL